jgi:hypothetical protein
MSEESVTPPIFPRNPSRLAGRIHACSDRLNNQKHVSEAEGREVWNRLKRKTFEKEQSSSASRSRQQGRDIVEDRPDGRGLGDAILYHCEKDKRLYLARTFNANGHMVRVRDTMSVFIQTAGQNKLGDRSEQLSFCQIIAIWIDYKTETKRIAARWFLTAAEVRPYLTKKLQR